ncbi:hypothetical protein HPB47_021230, partial [Ixodes persulcatus]
MAASEYSLYAFVAAMAVCATAERVLLIRTTWLKQPASQQVDLGWDEGADLSLPLLVLLLRLWEASGEPITGGMAMQILGWGASNGATETSSGWNGGATNANNNHVPAAATTREDDPWQEDTSNDTSSGWQAERSTYGGGGGRSGGGGGGSRGCFKCGEEGHMSRECPSADSGGGRSGGRGCFKCGEEGHMSRECPNADSSGGGGGGGGSRGGDSDRPKGCFKCQQEGHMAKDCTNEAVPRMGPDGKPMEAPYVPPSMPTDEGSIFEGISTGINFDKYDSIPVEVSDPKFQVPFTSFEEMGLCDLLLRNLRRAQYTKPTPVQNRTRRRAAGAGKLNATRVVSLTQRCGPSQAAFMLPILHTLLSDPALDNPSHREVQTPQAVILSPTRELAIQIAHDANKYAYDSILKTVLCYGGTSVGHQLSQLSRGCHILVATTGRLKDFVEKGKVSFENLRFLVLDEADRMLDMGFEPDVRCLVGHPTMPAKGSRQTLMFSATFPEAIQMLAREFLVDSVMLSVGILGAANSDVKQAIYQVTQFDKRNKLLEILGEEGSDRVMVFVEKKKTADFLAAFISQKGIKTT